MNYTKGLFWHSSFTCQNYKVEMFMLLFGSSSFFPENFPINVHEKRHIQFWFWRNSTKYDCIRCVHFFNSMPKYNWSCGTNVVMWSKGLNPIGIEFKISHSYMITIPFFQDYIIIPSTLTVLRNILIFLYWFIFYHDYSMT